jgi:hypothetical protein
VRDLSHREEISRQIARHALETASSLGAIAAVATQNLGEAVEAARLSLEDLAVLATRVEGIRGTVRTGLGSARSDVVAFRARVDDLDRRVAAYLDHARNVRGTVDGQARSFAERLRALLVVLVIVLVVVLALELARR